jgi:hypothetical protein
LTDSANIQFRPAFKCESGFAFENGERVPVAQPETDAEPGDDMGAEMRYTLSNEDMLTMILMGASDRHEVAARVYVMAMRLRHPHGPKSKAQFADWMNLSPSGGKRRWTAVFQYLQAFCEDLWAARIITGKTTKK